MDIMNRVWKWLKLMVFLLLFITGVLLFESSFQKEGESFWASVGEKMGRSVGYEIVKTHLPVFVYIQEEEKYSLFDRFVFFYSPLTKCLSGADKMEIAIQSTEDIDKLLKSEGIDEDQKEDEKLDINFDSDGILHLSEDVEKRFREENEQASGDAENKSAQENRESVNNGEFVKAVEKKQEYRWEYYNIEENLIKDFYAIDSTTEVTGNLLNVEKLRNKDMTIDETKQGPHILIYHTHSQEGFADSVLGDPSTTIVGAGERLAEILRDEYGFEVLHHTGEYDVEARDYAYSYALPSIEQILEENPNIDVVIDLHRDAVSGNKKLLTQINGRDTAQFMFFNGLSHTKKQGDIAYLENPYIEDNLAFSFQMQTLCNEYYPGVTRKIYLKGLRYNMHVKPKTLLIELGAQTNTMEEINHAIDILAHVLSMCLRNEG